MALGPITRIGRKLTGSAGKATKSTSSSFDNVVNTGGETVQKGISEAGTSYRSAYRTTLYSGVGAGGIYGGYKATDIWGDTKQAQAEAEEAEAFGQAAQEIMNDGSLSAEEKRELLAELSDQFNSMFGREPGESWFASLGTVEMVLLALVVIAAIKAVQEVRA